MNVHVCWCCCVFHLWSDVIRCAENDNRRVEEEEEEEEEDEEEDEEEVGGLAKDVVSTFSYCFHPNVNADVYQSWGYFGKKI